MADSPYNKALSTRAVDPLKQMKLFIIMFMSGVVFLILMMAGTVIYISNQPVREVDRLVVRTVTQTVTITPDSAPSVETPENIQPVEDEKARLKRVTRVLASMEFPSGHDVVKFTFSENAGRGGNLVSVRVLGNIRKGFLASLMPGRNIFDLRRVFERDVYLRSNGVTRLKIGRKENGGMWLGDEIQKQLRLYRKDGNWIKFIFIGVSKTGEPFQINVNHGNIMDMKKQGYFWEE